MNGDPVDVHRYLSRPLIARVATAGPTIRPVWFVYEDGAFWWLTRTTSTLGRAVTRGEEVFILVDSSDLASGEAVSVGAGGQAQLRPLDRERAVRTIAKYLGDDQATWDPRFVALLDDPAVRFGRLVADHVQAKDRSFLVSDPEGAPG